MITDIIKSTIDSTHDDTVDTVKKKMQSRGVRAAYELRNASQLVLRGQRSGRRYTVPGTGRMKYNKRNHTATITYKKYTASAPGEPPAVRTGMFRLSWTKSPRAYAKSTMSGAEMRIHSTIESGTKLPNGRLLGDLLEHGGPHLAPRPYQQLIINKATPAIKRIYKEPYV